MKVVLSSLLLVLGLSQIAQATENVCFNKNRVRDFHAVDRDTLIVREGFRREYQLEVFPCWELRWAERIAFQGVGGSQTICRGDRLLVLDNFSEQVVERCPIRSIKRIR